MEHKCCKQPNCKLDVYENEKCILHCSKEFWFYLDENNQKNWDNDKIKKFWSEIQEYMLEPPIDRSFKLSLIYREAKENVNLDHIIFPKLNSGFKPINTLPISYLYIAVKKISNNYQIKSLKIFKFTNAIFMDDVHFTNYQLDELSFYNTEFRGSIKFSSCKIKNLYIESEISNISLINTQIINNFSINQDKLKILKICNSTINNDFQLGNKQNKKDLDLLNFRNSTFNGNIRIKYCNMKEVNFENTTFSKLADFHGSVFKEKINFDRANFKDISVFEEVTFESNIDFKYTTFEELTQFKDAIFEKTLNLENTIIKKDINFLATKNKECKELKAENISNRETARIIKHSFEKLNNIIEANKFYALEMRKREKELKFFKNPLDWLVFKVHKYSSNHSQNWFLALFWIIILCIIGIENNLIDSLCKFFYSENRFDLMAKSFNSIFKFDSENIAFYKLMIKLFMGYLIYQFIISIRQNTRRK